MTAAAAIVADPDWREALDALIHRLRLFPRADGGADLAILFASSAYAAEFPSLVAAVRDAVGARLLVGCSGQGVIGPGKEIEGDPALALLVLALPGATLRASHLTQDELERLGGALVWHRFTGVAPDALRGWLIWADPYTLDADHLLASLSAAYPGIPLVGGLASGNPLRQTTHIFLDDRVFDRGAVLLAVGGPYRMKTVVSQGAAPIGRPWTITGAQGNLVETIGQRPAYDVLIETLRGLPPRLQARARGNLLVGLAVDERREELRRGDFLIRNLIGVIPETGALAVGAIPRVGQTLQFQVRDPAAAAEDLNDLLDRTKADLGLLRPLAALLCSCNGRGIGMFGRPHHDVKAVEDHLGPIPLAGVFCNGEIGPVGTQPYVHGVTARLALLVPDG